MFLRSGNAGSLILIVQAGRQDSTCTHKLTLVKEVTMLSWAVTFFIIAIIAAILGFSGIAGAAVNIAWILFVVGLVLSLVFFVAGRRPPV